MMWRGLVIAGIVVVMGVMAGCGGVTSAGPGSAIIGSGGGRVEASGVIVDVPPGALAADILITVLPLDAATLPLAPPSGQTLLAAARFEPGGLQFLLPVTLTFPLAPARTPGEMLPLYIFDTNTSTWQPSTFNAQVGANGSTAAAPVSHFSIYALFAAVAP